MGKKGVTGFKIILLYDEAKSQAENPQLHQQPLKHIKLLYSIMRCCRLIIAGQEEFGIMIMNRVQ